jgi:signal peptidase I
MSQRAERAARPHGLRDIVLSLAIVAVAAGLAAPFVVRKPYSVPGASMEPTLMQGDLVWARRGWPAGRPPRRGDLAVFRHPAQPVDHLKRIVGLPGDRIQMRGGLLYVNGAPVPRTHVGDERLALPYGPTRTVGRYREVLDGQAYLTNDFGPDGQLDDTPEYVVPAGTYFTLGDNRDNSADSRVPPDQQGLGFVPAKNLIGPIDAVLWSPRRGRGFFKP